MPLPKLSIGIPCYGPQDSTWWTQLADHAAQLHNWVEFGEFLVCGAMSTDISRNIIVKDFLARDDEWLLWIDADTMVPIGAIPRLLAHGKTLVSALYYGKNPPNPPIAYVRHGFAYQPLDKARRWEKGEIIPVDICGMGCMLTHRSVYEDIQKTFDIYQRLGGGLVPVPKESVEGVVSPNAKHKDDGKVIGGQYRTRLVPIDLKDVKWPFFALEYGRTEDLWFFEMAARAGHKPVLDTSVECGHLRTTPYQGKDYREQYGY